MRYAKKGKGRKKATHTSVRKAFPVVSSSSATARLIQVLLATLTAASRPAPRAKRLSAHEKARLDMFLSMRELALVTGFGENALNDLKFQDGFPLFRGKTTLNRFHNWAFAQSAPAAQTTPHPKRAPSVPSTGSRYEPFR